MPDNFFVSRSEAKARGLSTYFAGSKCKHGHKSERYTVSGACIACMKKLPADKPEPEQKLRTAATGFVWTEELRRILIDSYVDTGDIEGARQAIQLAPSEYYREIDRNPSFKDAIEKATVLAMETVDARAIHGATKGNDKLILAVLKAKLPQQYSDRLKIEQTTTTKLSNEELDRRIARIVGGAKLRHLPSGQADGETEDDPPRLQ